MCTSVGERNVRLLIISDLIGNRLGLSPALQLSHVLAIPIIRLLPVPGIESLRIPVVQVDNIRVTSFDGSSAACGN